MKYVIERYFKAKKVGVSAVYDTEERANQVCDGLNEKIKKITPFVTYKVKPYE